MQLKEMVLAILNESDLLLSDDAVEQIVDQVHTPHADEMLLRKNRWHYECIYANLQFWQTFKQADLNSDGRIDPDEWKEFASKNPALLKNMTLPYLK